MTEKKRPFRPDWTVHPGEHLEELLTVYGITQAELAERTGLSRKTINAIIRGEMLISAETAILLESVLPWSARTWMNLDVQYRERCAQIEQEHRIRASEQLIKTFPLPELKKRGIVPKTNDIIEVGLALLAFFAIGDFDVWDRLWQPSALQVAYRQQRYETKTPHIVSVWLREGQRAVEERPAPHAFNANTLRENLPRLRALSLQPADESWDLVREHCAEAGVTVVRVPHYPKLGVYAASYRYRGHTVIQLSGHQKSVDQVWFSLFHEIGHVLLHGVKDIFLDETDEKPAAPVTAGELAQQEVEADAFARRQLIPDGAFRRFVSESRGGYSTERVEGFAAQQGIHPSIVVGRLQHEQHLPYATALSALKRIYDWEQLAND